MVVCGLMNVGGCPGAPEQEATILQQLSERNVKLALQVQALERDREVAYNTLEVKRSENEVLRTQLAAQSQAAARREAELRASYDSQLAAALKRETELRGKLTTAEKLAADLADVANPSPTKSPPAARVSTPAEVKVKADLEGRIVSLQARINQEQSKVMALIRTTIDVRMESPAGGYISGGQIYQRVLTCGIPVTLRSPSGYTHTHHDSCYTTRSVGPSVKQGDFRSAIDKDRAIAAAKAAMLPLYEELKDLKQQLAEVTKP
jgi:hypothetical protein